MHACFRNIVLTIAVSRNILLFIGISLIDVILIPFFTSTTTTTATKYRALCVSNTDVSDLGVQWLCGDFADGGAPGCRLLVSLFIRYTNVTLIGVRLAMDTLNHLKYLDYETQLPEVTDAQVVLPTATLISFKCYKEGVVYLKNRLRLTKEVEIINYIIEPRVTDQHLADAVDSMREFDIDHLERLLAGADRFIRFAEGIVPFLNTFGSSLQEIKLASFDEVDTFFVLRACPRLITLNLDFNAGYTSSFPIPPTSQFLECFVYSGQNIQCIGDQELISILKAPNLKHLEILNCDQLTDSILETAFDTHQFAKLEILILRICNNLSSESFTRVFLSQINSLNVVVVDRCQQLCSTANHIKWSTLKCANKWDLNFTMNTTESSDRALRF